MIETLWTGSQLGEQVTDDRVPHLVVGGDQALFLAHHPGLLLRTGDHPHDPLLQLMHGDLAVALASGEQRRLVDQVREVGTGEARGLRRERIEVECLGQWLAAGVDFEDLLAALAVGAIDNDLAIEAARPQQAPGSRMSGRLVAAIKMMLSFISKPSISTSSWFSVCSRSS